MQFSHPSFSNLGMNRVSETVPFLALALILCVLPGSVSTAEGQTSPTVSPPAEGDTTEKGAPYVPTPRHVVLTMLELGDVSADDALYDLGRGDGRIVITAAKELGARGVGVEIYSQLVQRARRKARRAGVAVRVEFRQGDLFEHDLREATVVTLYLWPDMNNRLRPKLQRALDPGDRVVSHSFDIDGWPADSTVSMGTSSLATETKTLFRWTISDSSSTE